jgi:ABC-type antimicrobial peptide transport system permease subunit
VRAAGEPKALIATLQREFEHLDANLPFRDPRTMSEQMSAVLYAQRIGAVWLAGFGVVALLLASIGLYGLMSYTVGQRTREVGIRIALGAERRAIIGLVVRGATRLTVVGLAAGALLGVAAGFLLRSQLVGVDFFDPLGFVAAVLLLAAVALLAAWLPARRAAKVDPIVALQTE